MTDSPDKRKDPVQRKEVPGAPRQTADQRKSSETKDVVIFNDWALI